MSFALNLDISVCLHLLGYLMLNRFREEGIQIQMHYKCLDMKLAYLISTITGYWMYYPP